MLEQLQVPEGQKPPAHVELMAEASEAWRQQTKTGFTVSAFPKNVKRLLEKIDDDKQPSLEHLTLDEYFSIDLAYPGAPSCSLSMNLC